MLTLRIDSIQNARYQPAFQRYNVGKMYNPRQAIVRNYLLADWLGEPPAAIADGHLFDYGAHGKPRLKNGDAEYNIATSYDKVVLAVSDRPIGVDLEKVRPFDYRRIARGFRPEERRYLAALNGEEQVRATFKLWTVKEAVLKLTGLGLPGGVRSMQIDLAHFAYATRFGQQIKLTPLYGGLDYIGTTAQLMEKL